MTNPTNRLPLADRIRRCIANHPDWDVIRIASAVRGSNRASIKAVMAGEPIPERPVDPARPEPHTPAGTIELSAVRKRYDIAAAIRDELTRMRPGSLMLEREMCQRTAGRDAARFRRTIENTDEFRAVRVKLRLDPDQSEGAWYWGSAVDVAEAIRLRDE
jgi:hypothetical protein